MAWERKGDHILGGQVVARTLSGSGMPKDITKALKRARAMAQGDRLSWADSSLSSVGRNLVDHGHDATGSGDHLRGALNDAAQMYACLMAAVEALPPARMIERRPSSEDGIASVRQG